MKTFSLFLQYLLMNVHFLLSPINHPCSDCVFHKEQPYRQGKFLKSIPHFGMLVDINSSTSRLCFWNNYLNLYHQWKNCSSLTYLYYKLCLVTLLNTFPLKFYAVFDFLENKCTKYTDITLFWLIYNLKTSASLLPGNQILCMNGAAWTYVIGNGY